MQCNDSLSLIRVCQYRIKSVKLFSPSLSMLFITIVSVDFRKCQKSDLLSSLFISGLNYRRSDDSDDMRETHTPPPHFTFYVYLKITKFSTIFITKKKHNNDDVNSLFS